MTVKILDKKTDKPKRVFTNVSQLTLSKVSFSGFQGETMLYIVYDYHSEYVVINCTNSERANIKYRGIK